MTYFLRYALRFPSPQRGEKTPTSWLTWLKQLLVSARVQSRLQAVSGQRFLLGYSLSKFPSVPLISSPWGLGSESGVESARAALHCSEACASLPEEILNKWGRRSNRTANAWKQCTSPRGQRCGIRPAVNRRHCERQPSWRSQLGTALIMGNSIILLGRKKIPQSPSKSKKTFIAPVSQWNTCGRWKNTLAS